MRYYVTADVHGFYTPLITALTKAGFFADSAPHKLVILGDLFDRGKEALELQTFLSELLDQDKVILVRGNHEDLFEELVTVDTGLPYRHHVGNGTYDTALQLTGFDPRLAPTLHDAFAEAARNTVFYQKIIPAMLDYFETEHHIFVHGWIPCIQERNGYRRLFGKKPAGSMAWPPFDMSTRRTKPSSVAIGTPLLVTLQSTMPALNSVQMPISAPFTAQASLL